MFDRRCDLDGAEPALVELAWADADVRRFWLEEAVACAYGSSATSAPSQRTAQQADHSEAWVEPPIGSFAEWVSSPTRRSGVPS